MMLLRLNRYIVLARTIDGTKLVDPGYLKIRVQGSLRLETVLQVELFVAHFKFKFANTFEKEINGLSLR